MCGLAGLIHLDDSRAGPEDEASVRAMCDLLAYRGPDDSGVKAIGSACLGSRRLAIIDLSPAGHMPMGEPTGRWWIAYNGEVYNFPAVRDELERSGVRFQSHSDTEVLLQAWITWGRASLDRFVGMFAFAIYDRLENELTLVRDRFGVKPLYWSQSGRVVLFASEIKALLSQRQDKRLDQRGLAQWWLYRNVDALTPATLIEGIQQLMPGQLARIRDGRIRSTPGIRRRTRSTNPSTANWKNCRCNRSSTASKCSSTKPSVCAWSVTFLSARCCPAGSIRAS